MIAYTDWADVREALTEAQDKGLIESFRNVPVRGLVVVSGDMEEVDLLFLRDASYYLAGLVGRECAVQDGKAQIGTEGEGT